MYTILPFEKEFYRKFDYEVDYVGHPLIEEILKFEKLKSIKNDFHETNGFSKTNYCISCQAVEFKKLYQAANYVKSCIAI